MSRAKCETRVGQRLRGLSLDDPAPPLDTPEVVGGLKTRLFDGPKSIGSLWVQCFISLQADLEGLAGLRSPNPRLDVFPAHGALPTKGAQSLACNDSSATI